MIPDDIDNAKDRRIEKVKFGISFGDYLQKVRKSKKISQENLSMKAGYYRTYVNKIERGDYSPSMHTVWRLAYAMGMSLSEFFEDF